MPDYPARPAYSPARQEPFAADGGREVISVSSLNRLARQRLESAFPLCWVSGEISNLTVAASGHAYFSLKDPQAQVRCVMFRNKAQTLGFRLENGLQVEARVLVSLYEPRGDFQLNVEGMRRAGQGDLYERFLRLKAKLEAEGLFAAERKRPLPSMPAVVGVITSPTGAVIRDILHRIRDRWPCRVLVWPVVVQGEAAASQVCAAIRGFNAIQPDGPVPRPDILIVARGGGSVEDLWAFNDETLARTVAEGTIPLISAVGHETDTTLIDFVSDRRAPTPTAATEMATPVLAELRALISDFDRRLNRCGSRTIEERRTRLVSAARGLPRPADLLALAQQRFDIASGRLDAALQRNTNVHAQDLLKVTARLTPDALRRQHAAKADRLADLSRRLNACGTRAPERAAAHARLPALGDRLREAARRRLTRAEDQLTNLDKLRQSLNPERPLELGFALVRKADGSLARSAAELVSGERVNLKFKSGDRDAVIDGDGGLIPPTPAGKPRLRPATPLVGQGDLF